MEAITLHPKTPLQAVVARSGIILARVIEDALRRAGPDPAARYAAAQQAVEHNGPILLSRALAASLDGGLDPMCNLTHARSGDVEAMRPACDAAGTGPGVNAEEVARQAPEKEDAKRDVRCGCSCCEARYAAWRRVFEAVASAAPR